MVSADFAAAVVLISFCTVLGVTSPLQLIIMAVLETIIFVVNDMIGREYIGAVDVGCTIFIHLFGAFFGLAVARVLYNPEHSTSQKEASSYSSDLFSMVLLTLGLKTVLYIPCHRLAQSSCGCSGQVSTPALLPQEMPSREP